MIKHIATFEVTGHGDHAVREVFRMDAAQESIAGIQRAMFLDVQGFRIIAVQIMVSSTRSQS
jgi:hypothetical protein